VRHRQHRARLSAEPGLIAEGREADLVVCDAPIGSVGGDALAALAAGDLPGISMVLVDGKPLVARSRNTPPPLARPRSSRGRGRAAAVTERCGSSHSRATASASIGCAT
jgi:cytosine/adenosine deaminase-related metal-dependent hydrolase